MSENRGVNCKICDKRINVDEPMIMFSPERMKDNEYMHACCFQEHFLFEVWNALSLGIKYESRCQHVDYAAGFNPATFTAEDVAKAVEKQLGNRSGQRTGGKKWWRR